MPFEIVCCISSHDSLAYHFLVPIAQHELVTKLWIVRPQKSQYGEIPKAEYVLTPARFKFWRFVQMAWACLRLGHRQEVRAFVSFNPVPYGLIAFLAAKLCQKPIHLGFIGADWTYHAKSNWGRWLLPIFRAADFVTTTGESWRQEMLEYRFSVSQVRTLPHSIDLERYPVADPEAAQYTCIFVGELIPRKRVDLILQAFANIRMEHPDARLCVVGDGPLSASLQSQAAQLGITSAVDFVGFRSNLEAYLVDSKIVLIASDDEGLPFAMVKGICSGLVPISTPVGTIADIIIDGENGLLFPQNDATALANCLERLLDDPKLYDRLRRNVLILRENFAYDTATAVWDIWLNDLANNA